jgi:hypothetical protein
MPPRTDRFWRRPGRQAARPRVACRGQPGQPVADGKQIVIVGPAARARLKMS